VLLHGYGGSGEEVVAHLGFDTVASRAGFLLLAPDGTLDGGGRRFWNASDVCCDFERRQVDDVAYLRRLIGETRARVSVDGDRIYVVGFSNGGFMAQRLACTDAPTLAAVVSIAGAYPLGPRPCSPAARLSVLQVHGDADRVVLHAGGTDLLGIPGPRYPGARETVLRWAEACGCRAPLTPAGTMDLDQLPGDETSVLAATCPPGVDVRLWTVRAGGHLLGTPVLARRIWDWLEAHPRGPTTPQPPTTPTRLIQGADSGGGFRERG